MSPRLGPFLRGDQNILGDEPRQGRRRRIGFTEETIETAFEDGRYLVRGYKLATTGERIFKAGERAIVAWKDEVPVAIVAHSWRRAQFHPTEVPEEITGDFITVDVANEFTTVDSILVFSSFLQGDFAVRLAEFGVPDGVTKTARFVQNNPGKVVVSWLESLAGPDRLNFLVLQILDVDTGEFTPVPDETVAFAPGPVIIPRASATLLDSFSVKEDEIVVREITANIDFIWNDAELVGTTTFNDVAPPSLPGAGAEDSFTINSFVFNVNTKAPKRATTVKKLGPDLSSLPNQRLLFAVEIDEVVEVFMAVDTEFLISDYTPTSFTLTPSDLTIFDSSGSLVDGLTSLVLPLVSRATAMETGTYRLHPPMYLLNMRTKTVVFSTVNNVQSMLQTEYLSGQGNPSVSGRGDVGKRHVLANTHPTGFAVFFSTISSSLFVLTVPSHVTIGRDFVPPNPFTSAPWAAEAAVGSPGGTNLIIDTFGFSISRAPATGASTTLDGGAKSGPFFRGLAGTGPLTKATIAEATGYLGESLALFRVPVGISEQAGVPVSKLADWDGSSLNEFHTFTLSGSLLHANQAFAVIREAFPLTFFLFDRLLGTTTEFGADALANFSPGFFGTGFLISAERLFFSGDFATDPEDKALLEVGTDDEGKVSFTVTDELEAEEPADPVTFPLVDGRTSAVFPQEIEEGPS